MYSTGVLLLNLFLSVCLYQRYLLYAPPLLLSPRRALSFDVFVCYWCIIFVCYISVSDFGSLKALYKLNELLLLFLLLLHFC